MSAGARRAILDASRKLLSKLIGPIRRLRSSLRARLLVIFAILTTIPLGIVGVVSYSRSFSTIRENITSSATQMAAQLNTNIELIFRDTERFLRIGNHQTTVRFVNPYRQDEETTYRAALAIIELFQLFREIYEFDRQIKGIYILGFNGNNISEREGRFRLAQELGAIATVRQILNHPGEVQYVPNERIDYAAAADYGDVISVGKTIFRPSTRDVLGVIIVDVDRAAIVDLCRSIKMGETGYFALIGADGRNVYPESGGPGLSAFSPADRRKIAGSQEGSFVRAAGRDPEFVVFNTLAGAGWKIVGRVRLKELMRGAYHIRAITFAVVVLSLAFTVVLYFFISDALTHPIRDLKEKMAEAELGNLEVRAQCTNRDEIADLCHSFNVMIGKLKELLERSIREHEELKKSELKALQAQVNPHFLYNTLDAIVWMTEANKKEEVVRITKTLSSFFRIVLSKGEDWISVAEEIEHIRSYLAIQKMRYRDILDYAVDVDAEVLGCRVLKLTLQPLVENAIYHGIKRKRSGGFVRVVGRAGPAGLLCFEVSDDGEGMDPARLRAVRESLDQDVLEAGQDCGYGLKNVNQRIKLYYGRSWGVSLESEAGRGTRVALVLPAVR